MVLTAGSGQSFVGTSFMVLLRVERRPTVNMINPNAAMGLIG